jgi:hypothetical protein
MCTFICMRIYMHKYLFLCLKLKQRNKYLHFCVFLQSVCVGILNAILILHQFAIGFNSYRQSFFGERIECRDQLVHSIVQTVMIGFLQSKGRQFCSSFARGRFQSYNRV